nr:LPD38 domain-containing protein [Brevundimonas sp. BAL450]
MAAFGLALTAAYRDDEWYQGLSEYTRTNNWAIGLGGNRFALIPKPFELALPSIVAERAFEAIHFDDPTAWEKLVRGVAETLALPADTPFLKVPTELATNTNLRTGTPIVPQDRLDDLPMDQYTNWSSEFAMTLGEAINVSPAKVDHIVQGFAGSWGRWFLNASNLTDPDRPEGQLPDMPLSRRFFTESQRGNQDKTAFFERAGGRQSDLGRTINSVRERIEAGRPSEAANLLDDLDDSGRVYVQSQLVGLDEGQAAAQRRLHPLARARTVNTEIGRVIGEFYRSRPRDDGEPLPELTPRDKAMLQDALERLAVAEMRNAMILTRQPGYESRQMLDRASLWEDVREISPDVANELERRLTVGRDRAYSYEATYDLWPEVEARIMQDGERADLLDLASDAMGRSGF